MRFFFSLVSAKSIENGDVLHCEMYTLIISFNYIAPAQKWEKEIVELIRVISKSGGTRCSYNSNTLILSAAPWGGETAGTFHVFCIYTSP